MANQNSEINIDIIAKDLASKTISQINSNMRMMAPASKEGSDGMTWAFTKASLVVEALKTGLKFVGNIISGVVDKLKAMTKAVADFAIDYSRRGGEIQNVSVGFNNMFEDSEQAIKDLRKGAQGTISDFDLMLNANKASMLGVSSNSKQLAQLLEISRARAQALGVDSTYAFESIATGIGRMSPLILDNLGITTGAYKEQLKALEDTGVVVTDVMKKQLLLQTVLNDDSKVVMTLGILWEQLTASFVNAKDTIAIGLAPMFQEIGEVVIPLVSTAMQGLSDKFVEFAETSWPEIRDSLTKIKNKLVEWWLDGGSDLLKEKIDLITKAVVGEDSLASSFVKLLDPTQGAEGQLEDFMNNAVDSLTTSLIGEDGKGGLIGAGKELIDVIQDMDSGDWDNISKVVTTLGDAFGKLADAIDRANELWEAFMSNWELSKDLPTIGGSGFGNNGGAGDASGGGVGGSYATGGLASGRVLVGERGAEIVDLPAGSQVHTNEASKGMGGGVTININAPITGVDHLKEVIASAVDEIQSRQNRLANYNIL